MKMSLISGDCITGREAKKVRERGGVLDSYLQKIFKNKALQDSRFPDE
jgi:hypothetical protein